MSDQLFAALDLGSNSFHMIIARLEYGQIHVLDRLRETVRLAEGLDEKKMLSEKVQERGIECLKRFAERLSTLKAKNIRVVATDTLRVAQNGLQFLKAARQALGHSIEIISGQEEARLIYQGVTHDVGAGPDKQLVIDIGGGSTECMLGQGAELILAQSLHMGAVGFTKRFFGDGQLKKESFKQAELTAANEFRPFRSQYRQKGWERCLGSSGSITTIEKILRENGWSNDGITADGLKQLTEKLVDIGKVSKIELPGLENERAPIVAGAVAILSATFNVLKIDRMYGVQSALREGIIYDLLGRSQNEDIRGLTVRRMCIRFGVDIEHASRVERTALYVLDQLGALPNIELDIARRFLSWAAQLHEIGLAVALSGYHKHGEYLIANADMPGFSRMEQLALAALVRSHRRKVSLELFNTLTLEYEHLVKYLLVLLRISLALNRGRNSEALPEFRVKAQDSTIELQFPSGWLNEHPLTQFELQQERDRLKTIQLKLDVQ